jgi:hypothetical protein
VAPSPPRRDNLKGKKESMLGIITAERLRQLLHYDPDTGVLTWLINRRGYNGGVRIGDVAGWISTKGYRKIRIDGREYRAARLAWLYMAGEWPKAEIDHIDGDRADDRFCNLREATASQNLANAPMRADNTSGFKGVSWCKRAGKWRAHIKINGKSRTLGRFATPERAFIAYMLEAWKHYGDFARIDADYLVALRRFKARKEFETRVLWSLANPDYLIAA